MIIDTMANLPLYRGISSTIDRAIACFESTDPAGLPDGKTEIDGDKVYALSAKNETHEAAGSPFESHINYIDLQIVASGRESMLWAPTALLDVTQPYDAEIDAALYSDASTSSTLKLNAGWFCIFFPEDGHKPGCHFEGKAEAVHKVVVKCKVVA